MNFENIITQRVLAELSTFEGANFTDPAVCTALNSTTMMTLVDVQDDYPGFDAKAKFQFDPDVVIEVTWWVGIQGHQNTFVVKFDPLRIDRIQEDLYNAYDRAMSIL